MESRREMTELRRHLDWYHREIGEVVLWAAYDSSSSVQDPVYEEPGERAYHPPVWVQTLWISVTEAGKRLDQDRYDVRNNTHLAVSAEALRNAGVQKNIFNDNERVFDIFKYWGRCWSVVDYEILGRFPQRDSTTIGIQCVEIDLHSDYPFEPVLGIEQQPGVDT